MCATVWQVIRHLITLVKAAGVNSYSFRQGFRGHFISPRSSQARCECPRLLLSPRSISSTFLLATDSCVLAKDGRAQLRWRKRENSGMHIIVSFDPLFRDAVEVGDAGWCCRTREQYHENLNQRNMYGAVLRCCSRLSWCLV